MTQGTMCSVYLYNTGRKPEQSKTRSKGCILGLGTQKSSPHLLHLLPQSIRAWGFWLQPETPWKSPLAQAVSPAALSRGKWRSWGRTQRELPGCGRDLEQPFPWAMPRAIS